MPRFSLRDLFWLTLVCALGLGAAVNLYRSVRLARERERHAHYHEQLHNQIMQEGYEVVYSGKNVRINRNP